MITCDVTKAYSFPRIWLTVYYHLLTYSNVLYRSNGENDVMFELVENPKDTLSHTDLLIHVVSGSGIFEMKPKIKHQNFIAKLSNLETQSYQHLLIHYVQTRTIWAIMGKFEEKKYAQMLLFALLNKNCVLFYVCIVLLTLFICSDGFYTLPTSSHLLTPIKPHYSGYMRTTTISIPVIVLWSALSIKGR